MKEKELLRDFRFRDFLKSIKMNRKGFKKLSYSAKSKVAISYYTSRGENGPE